MSTLDCIKPGGRCRVHRVAGGDALTQRLLEMGFVEGNEVEVVRFAPLGDPMHVTLFGYHLSLRRSEASRVEVLPCV